MSDTTVQECINCGLETDCIQGICQECALDEKITIPTKRLYELLKFETESKRLREALEHIIEYWNRDENPTAMSDALWHILETAEQALKG